MTVVRPLVTRQKQLQALRLASAYPKTANKLANLAGAARTKITQFVAQVPEVKEYLGDRRYRVLGADLHVEALGDPKRLPTPHAEVSIYDYDRDVLVSVIVELRRNRILRIREYTNRQPRPSIEEVREAESLALKSHTVARKVRGKRTVARVLLAREAWLEGHPAYGHRVLHLTFWTRAKRPKLVAGPVLVDLSSRALLKQQAVEGRVNQQAKRR